jgi:hypothetical protein
MALAVWRRSGPGAVVAVAASAGGVDALRGLARFFSFIAGESADARLGASSRGT